MIISRKLECQIWIFLLFFLSELYCVLEMLMPISNASAWDCDFFLPEFGYIFRSFGYMWGKKKRDEKTSVARTFGWGSKRISIVNCYLLKLPFNVDFASALLYFSFFAAKILVCAFYFCFFFISDFVARFPDKFCRIINAGSIVLARFCLVFPANEWIK